MEVGVSKEETLEANLVRAGFDALRAVGGEALVQILLEQAGQLELANQASGNERIPIEQYLRYRDVAVEFLQESFSSTAFQTGEFLVRALKDERGQQMSWLIKQYEHAANKLPLIGQAAVLAAKGNPGTVQAKMKTPEILVISIDECPECRGIRRDTPFCYINQGVITEFARSYNLGRVSTAEKLCSALGDKRCEIEVTLESD